MSLLKPKPSVMILTPVYNEEASLPQYFDEVKRKLLSNTDYDIKILFIDDGSEDRSWNVIGNHCRQDARFQAIRLSRNYGSHIALCAGFEHADADAVAVLACDLQDPPEVILDFLEAWREGAKIVWGKRKKRGDEFWRVFFSNIFSTLMTHFAMPKGSKFTTGSFLLADRKVVECFCQFRERSRITFALMAWAGFEQAVVEYDRKKRAVGKSGWNIWTMLKAMYDAFVGFSLLPIRLMTLIGILVSVFAGIILAYLVWNWMIGSPLVGWTSVMFLMTLFFGLLFLLLGIVGEYLYRIYTEVVARPLYFISDQTNLTVR